MLDSGVCWAEIGGNMDWNMVVRRSSWGGVRAGCDGSSVLGLDVKLFITSYGGLEKGFGEGGWCLGLDLLTSGGVRNSLPGPFGCL